MTTYYDVTLNQDIPHGSDILNKPCSVTFTYHDGSHSTAYGGTVLAWHQPRQVRITSSHLNITSASHNSTGGTLLINSRFNFLIGRFALV